MPMHDWSKVAPNIYHHFHQLWTAEISSQLNQGLLPRGFSALIDQRTYGVAADVLAVESRSSGSKRNLHGTATLPKTRMMVQQQGQAVSQVSRANRISIRHNLGDVVCIIEIVSPGNKSGKRALQQFLEKTWDFLRAGVHVLLVDPFPPTPRDPHSLHPLIWDDIEDVPFEMPAEEPLLLASYRSGGFLDDATPMAFIEPFCVGATLPDMPAWLEPDFYVNVPLEASYQAAWKVCPADFQYFVVHGQLPEDLPEQSE